MPHWAQAFSGSLCLVVCCMVASFWEPPGPSPETGARGGGGGRGRGRGGEGRPERGRGLIAQACHGASATGPRGPSRRARQSEPPKGAGAPAAGPRAAPVACKEEPAQGLLRRHRIGFEGGGGRRGGRRGPATPAVRGRGSPPGWGAGC